MFGLPLTFTRSARPDGARGASGDLAAAAHHAAAAQARRLPAPEDPRRPAPGAGDARAHALVAAAAAAAACRVPHPRGRRPDLEPAGGRQQPLAAPDRARQRLCRRPRLARSHEPCRRAHRGGGTRRTHGRARGDGGCAGRHRASSPSAALERLRSFKPLPHLQDRQAHLESVRRFLESTPDANIVWISDGVAGVDGQGFIDGLAPMAGGSRMTVLKAERAPALARCRRRECRRAAQCRARCAPNRTGAIPARCAPSTSRACPSPTCASPSTRTPPRPTSPSTCRRRSATPSPASRSSAKAPPARSHLLDERGKRRRVGLVFGGTPIRRSRSCRRSTTSSGRSHPFRRSATAAARWPMP